MPSRRATLITATALAAILIASMWSSRGLTPRAAGSRGFSAERAVATLRVMLGGNTPHAIGTASHDAVRDRIAAQLQALGYLVQAQRAFACDPFNTCANVANIIARRPGDPTRRGVVLAAHYDSVPAGPGVSDDGMGVATLLEIARVVRQEPFRNPPVFLIDDGEEAGLLGAEAFVRDADLLKSTACVINIEARGTSGPSLLFETSHNNRWLAGHAVAEQRRPVTSSLFATIYDMLPNDTDLTVFKRAGLQGVNFGIVGNVAAYHTPFDNFESLSLRSLQHHGENALGVLRGVGNVDVETEEENAVWFDVLTLFVLRWPERATIWIAIASTIALLVASMLLVREERASVPAIALGALAFLASIIATAGAAVAIAFLGRLRADGATWIARPEPILAAMWIAGLLVTLLVFAAFRLRAGSEALQLGCGLAWHAVSIALALTLPGASYLFLVPAVALSVWSLLRAFGAQFSGDVAIAAVAAAIVLFPLGLRLHDALGAPSLTVIAVSIALVATTFAALSLPISRAGVVIGSIAIAACIVTSLALPSYDSGHRRRINVLYIADDGNSRWAVSKATNELRQAAPFRADATIFPWIRKSPFETAAAPNLGAPPVQISVERDDRGSKRTIVWRIRSLRNASRVALAFRTEAHVESIRINGVTPPPATRGSFALAPGWHHADVLEPEASVEVTLSKDAPIDCVALDYSYGAPAGAASLVAARDASIALPSGDGDMTITMTRTRM